MITTWDKATSEPPKKELTSASEVVSETANGNLSEIEGYQLWQQFQQNLVESVEVTIRVGDAQ